MNAKQGDFVGYFSIIPGSVRNDPGLSATAKLFFGDISSIAQTDGYCYASNAYFAERFGLTERTVSRTIKLLEGKGHVKTRLCRNRVTGQIVGRRIYPQFNPLVPNEADIEECDVAENDGENVTFHHMTFLSEPVDKNVLDPPTKMSTGLIRKSNLKQEDNIPPVVPQKKKRSKVTDDTAAREELQKWAASLFQGRELAELTERLMQFCDMRRDKGNMLGDGRAVTALTGKLRRYSYDRLDIMLELLDKSIISRWDSVYALKSDELRSFGVDIDRDAAPIPAPRTKIPEAGTRGEDGYKWL